MIADKEAASADNIVSSLRASFKDEKTRGVILRINSQEASWKLFQFLFLLDKFQEVLGRQRIQSAMLANRVNVGFQ